MHDVVLIYPPFADIESPALGLSNFKTLLEAKNISCKIIYANIIYRDLISKEIYRKINEIDSAEVMYCIAEFIFSSLAFPTAKEKHEILEKKILELKKDNFPAELLIQLKKDIKYFTDKIIEILDEEKPKIVGFNSTFNQTCAAVALANEIKKSNKNIITILGGFNCNQPMVNVLQDITPNINYIFSGEAEDTFTNFVVNTFNNKLPDQKIIYSSPIKNLDSLPYPDYTDYFEQLSESDFKSTDAMEYIRLTFESSRGCWWSKCTFCGQNSTEMYFREKSPQRIRDELSFLSNFYKHDVIFAVDTALPEKSAEKTFKEFNKPPKLEHLIYQLRNNISFKELEILKEKGIKICHPGIESINDHLLTLMNKGSSALNNIRVLRDCKTLNLFNFWNLLYGLPGENKEDYEAIIKLIPHLYHLRPPSKELKIRIVRYSPFFNSPDKHGVKNIRPKDFSGLIYPDHPNIDDLTLNFEGDYQTAFDDTQLEERFFSALNKWKTLWLKHPPEFDIYEDENNTLSIIDTRDFENQQKFQISKHHLSLLKKLNTPIKFKLLLEYIKTNNLQDEFNQLTQKNCIVEISGSYLSLVGNYI